MSDKLPTFGDGANSERRKGSNLTEYVVCFLIFIPVVALTAELGAIFENKKQLRTETQVSIRSQVCGLEELCQSNLPVGNRFMTYRENEISVSITKESSALVPVPSGFGTLWPGSPSESAPSK